MVDHPEKSCVQCGRSFKTNQRHQLTCSKECARLRQLAIKSRLYKEAYARNAANRAAIREERERQRALRSPIKKKKSFVVSSTLTCPGCGGQIARADAVLGCCAQACADALIERRSVKSITDRVAVGERVLVSHYSRMTIGDVERLVGTSDAGEIIDIAGGIARIRHPGGVLECAIGEIGTTETSVQVVKRRIEANTNWRERHRGYKVKYGVTA